MTSDMLRLTESSNAKQNINSEYNYYTNSANKNLFQNTLEQQNIFTSNNTIRFRLDQCIQKQSIKNNDMKSLENYTLRITNLPLFLNQQKVKEMCLNYFQSLEKIKVKTRTVAKELQAGGQSNRVQMMYDEGVFFVMKQCSSDKDNNEFDNIEKEAIIILSQKYITLPLIINDDKSKIEQVAGVQSLSDVKKTIDQLNLHKDIAFIPFIKCLMIQLFDKLCLMHQCGYAHSDIKPANIVMGFDRYFYFIDFGGCVNFKDQKSNLKYLRFITKAFNTKYFYQLFKDCKEFSEQQIIFCENAQLSLSILYLLNNKSESNYHKKEKEEYKEIIHSIFELFKTEKREANNDIIQILQFLFSFILYPMDVEQVQFFIKNAIYDDPQNNQVYSYLNKPLPQDNEVYSFNQTQPSNYEIYQNQTKQALSNEIYSFQYQPQQPLSDEFYSFLNKTQQQLDNEQYEKQLPYSLILKDSFPLDDVIQFYSKIEEIEFDIKNNEISIKTISLNNIKLLELLSNLGQKIRCKGYLNIRYDIIKDYEYIIQIIQEESQNKIQQLRKCDTKQDEDDGIEILAFDKQPQENKYYFQYIKGEDKYKRVVYLDNRLQSIKDDPTFPLLKLSSFLTQNIDSFKKSLEIVSKSFKKYNENSSFINYYNECMLKQQTDIKIKQLLDDTIFVRFSELINHNMNIQSLSINISQLSEQSHNKLAIQLQKYGNKACKQLHLKGIKYCDEEFKKVIQINWNILDFTSHKDLKIEDYKKLYIPSQGYACKTLKINFKNLSDFDYVSKNILQACQNVQNIYFDFREMERHLSLQDDEFSNFFPQVQTDKKYLDNSLELLDIKLLQDDGNYTINEKMIEYLLKSEKLNKFQLHLNCFEPSEQFKNNIENKMDKLFFQKQQSNKYKSNPNQQDRQFKYLVQFGNYTISNYPQIEQMSNDIISLEGKKQSKCYLLFNNLIQLKINNLTEIILQSLKLPKSILDEILECSFFSCQFLKKLTISLLSFETGKENKEFPIKKFTKENSLTKNINHISLDFQKVSMEINEIQRYIELILSKPEQLLYVHITFNLINSIKSQKTPFKIQKNIGETNFIIFYSIIPTFKQGEEDYNDHENDTKKCISLYRFMPYQRMDVNSNSQSANSKNSNIKINLKLDLSFAFETKDNMAILKRVQYILSGIMINQKINMIYLILGEVNYTISANIAKILDYQYNNNNKLFIESFHLEIKATNNSIKDLIFMALTKDNEIQVFQTISYLDKDICLSLENFIKSKNKNRFLILKNLPFQQFSTCFTKINQILIKYKIFFQVKIIPNQEEYLNYREFLLNPKIQQDHTYFQLEQSDSANRLQNETLEQSTNNQISSSQTPTTVYNEQQNISLTKDKSISLSSNNSDEFNFKMIQDNFDLFLPYYQFSKNSFNLFDISIGQGINNFTIPYREKMKILIQNKKDFCKIITFECFKFWIIKIIFLYLLYHINKSSQNQNFPLQLFQQLFTLEILNQILSYQNRIEKFCYLQKLAVEKNESIKSIQIDFSKIKLDLDLAIHILELFKQNKNSIKTFSFDVSDTYCEYSMDQFNLWFDTFSNELSQFNQIEFLYLKLNHDKFDNSKLITNLIHNLASLKHVEIQIYKEFTSQSLYELLDKLESHPSLKVYKLRGLKIIQNNCSSFQQIHQQQEDKFIIKIDSLFCLHSQSDQLIDSLKNLKISYIEFHFDQAEYISEKFLENILDVLKQQKVDKVEFIFSQLCHQLSLRCLFSHFNGQDYQKFNIKIKDKDFIKNLRKEYMSQINDKKKSIINIKLLK